MEHGVLQAGQALQGLLQVLGLTRRVHRDDVRLEGERRGYVTLPRGADQARRWQPPTPCWTELM
jgi:hypothetical protein